jgi:hypothetical protein
MGAGSPSSISSCRGEDERLEDARAPVCYGRGRRRCSVAQKSKGRASEVTQELGEEVGRGRRVQTHRWAPDSSGNGRSHGRSR